MYERYPKASLLDIRVYFANVRVPFCSERVHDKPKPRFTDFPKRALRAVRGRCCLYYWPGLVDHLEGKVLAEAMGNRGELYVLSDFPATYRFFLANQLGAPRRGVGYRNRGTRCLPAA